MKITKRQYNSAVKKAKSLIFSKRGYRVELAKITISVCEIQTGGHKGAGLYSVRKFANDIGIDQNMLRGWVRHWDLVESKISGDIRAPRDTTIIKLVCKRVDRLTPAAEVEKIYREENTLFNKFEHRLKTNLRYFSSIISLIEKHGDCMRKNVSNETVVEMKKEITKLQRSLNKVLD